MLVSGMAFSFRNEDGHAAVPARWRALCRPVFVFSRPPCRALNFPARPQLVLSKEGTHGTISRHHHRVRASRQPRRTGRRWPGHPGQHRHQGHGAQDPPPVPRQDPGRLRRRHRRRLHAAGALRGQARETPGQPDARGGRTHPRLAHRPRAAPPGSHADRGRRRAHAGTDRQRRRARASTAWRPSARAAPMPSRPRWRCCATPSCHPRPSSSSRWKSPATCASTPTRTTSSKRWANDARRAARPQRRAAPSPA